MKIVLLFALAFWASTSALLSREYKFSVSLNDDDTYRLHWTIDNSKGTINVGIETKTTGWIGFGLSPDGKMPNSDIVTGWVKDEKGFLQDRHSLGRFLPPLDSKQNVELIAASEDDTTTVLEFTRSLRACERNDTDVPSGTARVIWAYHPADPESIDGLMQHAKSGSKSVNLLTGFGSVRAFPSGTPSFQLTTTVPSSDTTYWCKPFRLPVLSEGGYLIGEIVHHMVVYRCDSAAEYVNQEGPCHTLNGNGVNFPDDVGIPFSGNGSVQYALLEMHYNNVEGRSDHVDSFGLEFFYRTTPPKHNATILEIGQDYEAMGFFLPPGLTRATVTSYCSQECTKVGVPSEGSKVFATLLHSHLAGVAIRVKQFRNETFLGYVARNEYYDFNFQDFTFPLTNVTIRPGDALQTECDYSTVGRTGLTRGGLTTSSEMCLAYMIVYPSTNAQSCLSQSSRDAISRLAKEADAQGWGTYYGDGTSSLRQSISSFNFSKPGADVAYLDYLHWQQKVECKSVGGERLIDDAVANVSTASVEPPTVQPECTNSLDQPPTFVQLPPTTTTATVAGTSAAGSLVCATASSILLVVFALAV
ncbi:DBH-like monooxygenase protein 1 homolog [Oscarella lobularis]|uniref:DBH-like monooxygenase protein 1 homolog n=1 Tax=Oscarella lobularis TaxID=121494 RepID=UPI0033142667